MRKARSLTPSQIKKALKKCLLMQEPELKRAMSLEYIDISPDQLSKAAVQAF